MNAKTRNGDNLLTVGLDMDGVILDSTRSKIAFAKKMGYALVPKDTQADRIEEIMASEELEKLRYVLYQDPVTGLRADLVEGAKNGLARLKTGQFQYYLISRRQDLEIARAVLKKRGLWPTYFNEQNAFFVGESGDKNKKAVELGIQVYIDDQPGILETLVDVPRKFLFDRFANFEGHNGPYTRITSWTDFLSHIL